MKKAIMSVLTVWILVSSMFIGLISFSDIENVQAPYIPHSPIRINSNAEFASMAGSEGWAGNGLPGNPYIIEGYDINGSGYGYCIYIGNTTVYFEIRDSYLHEESDVLSFPYYFDSGIMLYNVQNSTISNNTVSSNNWLGIYLNDSNNVTIINNNLFSNNWLGINLNDSNNVTIINNNLFSNTFGGIGLFSSSNSSIANNKASSSNEFSIYLYNSRQNTIANNTASSNNQRGIYLHSSSHNSVINNTASIQKYGIFLIQSNHTIITYNNVSSNTNGGIGLIASCNNTIGNNTALNNKYGIQLEYDEALGGSSNDNIVNNNIAMHNEYGIYLRSSDGNTIINNTASYNSVQGMAMSNCIENSFINNKMDECGVSIWGESLKSWNSHKIVTSNTVNGKPVYYWKNQTSGEIPVGVGEVILANCTNVIVKNQNVSNGSVGILLGFSNNTTIINNNASSNKRNGIALYYSSRNTIINNNVSSSKWDGIYLYYSSSNTLANNTASNNTNSIHLRYSDDNTIANNTASNSKYGIYLLYSDDNTIVNSTKSNNEYGIQIWDSDRNTIDNNTISNNTYGIDLYKFGRSTIINNNVSDNDYGIYLNRCSGNTIANNCASNNDYGIYIKNPISKFNSIYHNNIINNTNQAYDEADNVNQWDKGYPLGGNYWSDYIGVDNFKGPKQDIPGSDGIGDTPYLIDADSQDNYPLMAPFTNRSFDNYMTLKQGWNLLSIPFIQQNQSLKKVLEMIEGYYDAVQWYNNTDLNDLWKHYRPGKPLGNDLFKINETMGFWVHITNPGDTIFLYNGTEPTSNQSITLHPGWNMVGYPSLSNRTRDNALNNINYGTDVDAIWTFNAATQTWQEIGPSDYFELGKGYWIHSKVTKVWDVPL